VSILPHEAKTVLKLMSWCTQLFQVITSEVQHTRQVWNARPTCT